MRYPYTILTDKEYGDRFLYAEISPNRIKGAEFAITAVFRVYRNNYKKCKFEGDPYRDAGRVLKRFRSSDRLVPIEGKIAEEAYAVTKGNNSPFLQAKKRKIPDKYQIWIDARKRHHLSHAHILMARELAMNPKKFGRLANHHQEPWKLPLPQFIEECYFKRFGKPFDFPFKLGLVKSAAGERRSLY